MHPGKNEIKDLFLNTKKSFLEKVLGIVSSPPYVFPFSFCLFYHVLFLCITVFLTSASLILYSVMHIQSYQLLTYTSGNMINPFPTRMLCTIIHCKPSKRLLFERCLLMVQDNAFN